MVKILEFAPRILQKIVGANRLFFYRENTDRGRRSGIYSTFRDFKSYFPPASTEV